MKLDHILTKSVRLAKKGDYDSAIKTLENEANRYYGSFIYSYILGNAYLYSNIYGVALSYFNFALTQKSRDVNAMLGLAALYLNHGDTDRAVDLYLEILTIDASNGVALKALRLIRKHPGPENISAWIESGRLHTIFPPFPKLDIEKKSIVKGILIGVVLIFIFFGVLIKTGIIPSSNKGQREIPEAVVLAREDQNSPIQTGGSYRYVLTRNQVLDEYNEARKLFTVYRDEAAKLRLNRILESNASEPIKEKARILISFMEVPGFNSIKDNYNYSDVIKDPFLYRDCHVIWRGMASNLLVEENHTSFDLLVGYDTHRVMEGIVRVDYNFAIPVNTERPVEILGRVIPVSVDNTLNIRIQGVALNQAGLLDQAQNPVAR